MTDARRWHSVPKSARCALALVSLFATTSCGSREPDASLSTVAAALGSQTCVTFQRGGPGPVADTYLKTNALKKNFGALPVLRVSAKEEALLRFDLSAIPTTAAIGSATLKLFVNGAEGDGTIRVHRVLAPWSEDTVTFASFGQRYAGDVAAEFRVESRTALKNIDLTALVKDWVQGQPNAGVLLNEGPGHHPICDRDEDEDQDPTIFVSSDASTSSKRPALEICYTVPVDHCAPAPCLNGGTCTNEPDGRSCKCPPGFTGSNCETNINDCASTPCLNGGTCVDAVAGYMCSCAPGFAGLNCETNIDDCTPNPCQNGGVCTDGIAMFTCACPPGFDGPQCDHLIDSCASMPCHNGGTCVNGVGSYSCACAFGFTGPTCDTNIDDCVGATCGNGTCIDGIGNYSCSCAPDWGGTHCDVNLNSCAQSPCLNGGTCSNGFGNYTCGCSPGYAGTNCEIDINDCAPNPCLNGGTCIDGVNSHSCTCPPGTTGTNCETQTPPPCTSGGDTSCFRVGVCAAGNVASSCNRGVLTPCQTGAPSGISETVCNRLDDDCDGQVDEDAPAGTCAKTINVVVVYDSAAQAQFGITAAVSPIAQAFGVAAARFTAASNATGAARFTPPVSLNLAAQVSWAGSPPSDMPDLGSDPVDMSTVISRFATWVAAHRAALGTAAGTPADHVMLLTGHSDPNSRGLAFAGTMCGTQSVSAISVVPTPFASAGSTDAINQLGNLIGHQLGHSLGMQHDTTAGFVMSPAPTSDAVTFSPASATALATWVNGTYAAGPRCLDDPATVDWSSAHCGDGRKQGGEQCDPTVGLTDACCTSSCRRAAGCDCGNSDPCCASGVVLPASSGHVCRAARDECDLTESCDGTTADCPRDLYDSPGTACSSNGTCLRGVCRSGDLLCKEMDGPMAVSVVVPPLATTCTALWCQQPETPNVTVAFQPQPVDGIPCGAGSQCSAGSCTQSLLLKDYVWATGAWSACASGIETRSVSCADETGTVVLDSNCHNFVRPLGTRSCQGLCDPDPCQNGGVCFNAVPSLTAACQCPAGFLGTYCEVDVNYACVPRICPAATVCACHGGSGANLAGKSGSSITLVGASGFQAGDVGSLLFLTAAANPSNVGHFKITAVNSASSVTVTNSAGVNEATGSVTWTLYCANPELQGHCNAIDDDCNGVVDDCTAGVPGSCCADIGCLPYELCNGLDDNCNGVIDENPVDVGGSCSSTQFPGTLGVLKCCSGDPALNLGACPGLSSSDALYCVGGGGSAGTCNSDGDCQAGSWCSGNACVSCSMGSSPCGAAQHCQNLCGAGRSCNNGVCAG